MMRRILMVMLTLMLVLGASGPLFAEYDISGRWLLEGGGYAEKGVLRVELEDEGHLDVHTSTESGDQYLTGYTVKVTLDASKLGINAWEYSDTVTLPRPVRIPELDPTTNEPFELPAVTVDGLTYKVTFTSTTSGTVEIYGSLDMDVVGTVNIDSMSAIWKEGTEKPDIEDMSSGCNAGFSVVGLLALFSLAGLKRRSR